MRITPSTAHTIVEELAKGDRRKRNIMYNLPEARDKEADKVSALSSVYSRESPINRVVRLEINIGCYWYALRIWMTRLFYSANLIFYTEMNSLKWSM